MKHTRESKKHTVHVGIVKIRQRRGNNTTSLTMYVQRYIAERSHNHCCHGNATLDSLFVVGVDFDAEV